MDCITFLKHLIPDYVSLYGFLLFGNNVKEVVGLLFLFAFGFKSLCYYWCSRGLIRFLRGYRVKTGGLRNGFCSKNVSDGKSNLQPDTEEKNSTDSDDEFDTESDVSVLRKWIRIERRRANAAVEELEKERAASATAAEEAMAMILRLQNEKSVIEMESNQYRRVAEEKQLHDQEVITSLQWLIWRQESETSSFEEMISCRTKLKFEDDVESSTCLDNEDVLAKIVV